jgi:hypothetical protein
LSAKNLIEAKRVVKSLLKKELSEKHITSKNICNDIAFIRSDKTFCLVKFMDQISDNFSEVFPVLSKKIDWNRYVTLEKDVFERYLEQFESLKKEYPIKGTVIFVIRTGEIYMTSPYVLYGLSNEFDLLTRTGKKEIICFPTAFLSVPEGHGKPYDEIEAQKRLSIISQINSINEDFGEDMDYYESDYMPEFYDEDFFTLFPREGRRSSPRDNSRFSEPFPEDMQNVALNLLYEISMSLKELTKEIKSINRKTNKGK